MFLHPGVGEVSAQMWILQTVVGGERTASWRRSYGKVSARIRVENSTCHSRVFTWCLNRNSGQCMQPATFAMERIISGGII